MSDDPSKSAKEFSVSASGVAEQKRQSSIDSLRDKTEKMVLQTMMHKRNEHIDREKKRLENERAAIAQKEIDKKEQGRQELHNVMKGAPTLSPEKRKEIIKKAVENKYGPIHEAMLDARKDDLNKPIDKRLQEAKQREEKAKGQQPKQPDHAKGKDTSQDKSGQGRRNADEGQAASYAAAKGKKEFTGAAKATERRGSTVERPKNQERNARYEQAKAQEKTDRFKENARDITHERTPPGGGRGRSRSRSR